MTLRDILARITRALEAMRDGDTFLADQILDDLAADIWPEIEALEKSA